MNEQYFQVDVERATPACDANCPNLQIDVEDLEYAVDNIDDLHKLRKIRCINDTWCQRLQAVIEKNSERLMRSMNMLREEVDKKECVIKEKKDSESAKEKFLKQY